VVEPAGVPQPPIIDGDLSDWPAVAGNTAEDFVLVTGEDPMNPRQPITRPTSNTQCFVAADQNAIYLALNCTTPAADQLTRNQRNYLRYQDGVPENDELIEILIDPANVGTRSPGDLFHIVIKPSSWFCERGLVTDPPVGPRLPWAADMQMAVQTRPDRWVAEVRIPLEAFGNQARSTAISATNAGGNDGLARQMHVAVWGINITRFDVVQREFSNWSGAANNVYDPLSLGNLLLPGQ
jgi:hypothetical protein